MITFPTSISSKVKKCKFRETVFIFLFYKMWCFLISKKVFSLISPSFWNQNIHMFEKLRAGGRGHEVVDCLQQVPLILICAESNMVQQFCTLTLLQEVLGSIPSTSQHLVYNQWSHHIVSDLWMLVDDKDLVVTFQTEHPVHHGRTVIYIEVT